MKMYSMTADFSDEQKRYLEGFMSGVQAGRFGRSGGGAGAPAADAAPAATAALNQPGDEDGAYGRGSAERQRDSAIRRKSDAAVSVGG